jgi:hypothetical protein
MRNWESDVALYLLAGFLVLALFLVEGGRLNILQSMKDLLAALV